MLSPENTRQALCDLHACVIIPTYNNAGTLLQVLERVKPFAKDVWVVDDGSTDDTAELLKRVSYPVTVISYPENRGKGHALRTGFLRAMEKGFEYAVTLDSDGQHYPEDIPALVASLCAHPGALVVGSRCLKQENMPGKNTFANRFSNFWFAFQTWQRLPDTQTGFRLYPLRRLSGLKLLTSRYEAELELLVLAAWRGVRLVPTPIRVYYPPQEERISHFRPFTDFARISLLNTVLCLLSFVYGWPSVCIRKILKKEIDK